MTSCRHQNITIIETGEWFTTHDRDEDGWSHWSSNSNYREMVDVECGDCGMKRRYNRYRLPKWLKEAFDEALEQQPQGETS